MKFFTKELYAKMQTIKSEEENKEFLKEFVATRNACFSNYEKIKEFLPKSIVLLLSEINFHDSQIVTVNRDVKNRLVMKIDFNRFLNYKESYCLTFKGIKLADIPEGIVGSCCIWHEVHLHDVGRFDFRMLVDIPTRSSLDIIRIVADDLLLLQVDE